MCVCVCVCVYACFIGVRVPGGVYVGGKKGCVVIKRRLERSGSETSLEMGHECNMGESTMITR